MLGQDSADPVVWRTAAVPGERNCVACDAVNGPSSRFCSQCGAPLTEPDAPHAVAARTLLAKL